MARIRETEKQYEKVNHYTYIMHISVLPRSDSELLIDIVVLLTWLSFLIVFPLQDMIPANMNNQGPYG